MKAIVLSILGWMVVFFCMPCHAESYDKLWKQVRQYEEKDLPRSAYGVVERIAVKADKERQKGQQMASLLYGIMLRKHLVPDSFYNDLRRLEKMRKTTTDEVERAVLCSVLGELYENQITRTKNVSERVDAHPDSIREWSQLQYLAAAEDAYYSSLCLPEKLAEAKVKDYLPFVKQGTDAGYFGGDLLNVIGRRMLKFVETMQKVGFYRGFPAYYNLSGQRSEEFKQNTGGRINDVLDIYRRCGNREAELLLSLDSVRAYVAEPVLTWSEDEDENTPEGRERQVLASEKYKALSGLIERFRDIPLTTEVYIELMQLSVTSRQKVLWVEEALARYSSYPRVGELAMDKAELEKPLLEVSMPAVAYPAQTVETVVTRRNVDGADLYWYLLPADVLPDSKLLREDQTEWMDYALRKGRLVKHESWEWKKGAAYEEWKDTFALTVPDIGLYVVIVNPKGGTLKKDGCAEVVHVSRLKVLQTKWKGGAMCRVVDALTGEPIAKATVDWKKSNTGKLLNHTVTDAMGRAYMHSSEKDNRFWEVHISKGNDRYLPPIDFYGEYVGGNDNNHFKEQQREHIYTDRAIYRPGQTVYVGGLLTVVRNKEERVRGEAKTRLTLTDPFGKKVKEEELTSDEWGKYTAELILSPTGALGWYTLRGDNGSTRIKVEEYKRPTFEVEVDEVVSQYAEGDTIQVTGLAMAYNGVPVRHARVTGFTAVRRWFYRSRNMENKMLLDTVYTDENGRFSMPVVVSRSEKNGWMRGVRQLVELTVLNAAGESHGKQMSFPLSGEALSLSVNAPVYWDKTAFPTVRVQVRNSSYADVTGEASVTYELYRRFEKTPRQKMHEGMLPADGRLDAAEVTALPSGLYTMEVCAVACGDTVRATQDFILFDASDTRPVDGVTDWFYCANDTVSPGCPARIQVGSGASDVTLYYMLSDGERMFVDTLYTFTDSVLTFEYSDLPSDKPVKAIFCFVKDNQVYGREQVLERAEPKRTLQMEWTSFRNRLQPGQEETWRLVVKTPDGKPASAQLMATLYDASLEALTPHGWNFSPLHYYDYPRVQFLYSYVPEKVWFYQGSVELQSVKPLSFDSFDTELMDKFRWYGARLESVNNTFYLESASSGMRMKGTGSTARSLSKAQAVSGRDEALAEEPEEESASSGQVQSVIRENLRETAFFYPRLQTDKSGKVSLSFTLPESLTTWKFMALAHTPDVMTGMLEDEVTAAKEVMAQLNLPRFVRKGDKATLSVTLNNLTEKKLKGKVTMEVFDPMTEKVLWRETLKLKLETRSDTVIPFIYIPEGEVTLPACRVMFEAGRHSDGEQRYLPVLEDKDWLTQTLPFTVSHRGDTVIMLNGLFQNNHPEADYRRLTVEYTANPLWYVVQALPSLSAPNQNDALSLAAAYYASVLSSDLSAAYPQMKKAVELWQVSQTASEQDVSHSWKEVLGMVREETPWAEQPTDDRWADLQQLFDANRQTDLQRTFAERLGRLQCADGSFGWFEGMPGSLYMTMRVAELLLRTGASKIPMVDMKRMMGYLSAEMHKEVEREQKKDKDGQPIVSHGGGYWLDYLRVAGRMPSEWMDVEVRKDIPYMLSRLTEDRYNLSMADKAGAAVVLYENGKGPEAEELVQSLREHLVDGADGLHLEYPSGGFYGSAYKIAVHTAIMEAFTVTGMAEASTLDSMCRWLLAQKRVQDWGSSLATTDAVSALLRLQGKDLSMHTADVITLLGKDGKESVKMNSDEGRLAGLGSVVFTVADKTLEEGAGQLAIHKEAERPSAWGAVYAQFRMPLNELESSGAGLRIRCETDNLQPKVGDRLKLRYVVTADRDYDYVHLKAGRAACLEPLEARSGYAYSNGLSYYREVRDASTSYFFEKLPKGTYVLEMECYVERPGRYAVGAVKLTGVYAPEFGAYGSAPVLEVRP